jgi:hypothetical protein
LSCGLAVPTQAYITMPCSLVAFCLFLLMLVQFMVIKLKER